MLLWPSLKALRCFLLRCSDSSASSLSWRLLCWRRRRSSALKQHRDDECVLISTDCLQLRNIHIFIFGPLSSVTPLHSSFSTSLWSSSFPPACSLCPLIPLTDHLNLSHLLPDLPAAFFPLHLPSFIPWSNTLNPPPLVQALRPSHLVSPFAVTVPVRKVPTRLRTPAFPSSCCLLNVPDTTRTSLILRKAPTGLGRLLGSSGEPLVPASVVEKHTEWNTSNNMWRENNSCGEPELFPASFGPSVGAACCVLSRLLGGAALSSEPLWGAEGPGGEKGGMVGVGRVWREKWTSEKLIKKTFRILKSKTRIQSHLLLLLLLFLLLASIMKELCHQWWEHTDTSIQLSLPKPIIHLKKATLRKTAGKHLPTISQPHPQVQWTAVMEAVSLDFCDSQILPIDELMALLC